MSDVFISYAREDIAAAKDIAETLGNRGLTVFWDRTIPAGSAFEDVIEREIRDAKAVVVLWSKHSVRSDWVRAEASEGADRRILVPATLDGGPAPLRYRIAQTADLTDWTPGYPTQAFGVFLEDVTKTVFTSGPPRVTSDMIGKSIDRPRVQSPSADAGRPSQAKMHRYLVASTVCAWVGSTALAVTVAYDYGVIQRLSSLHVIAYYLTLLALAVGGIAAGILGSLSLKRQFVIGVLQGWVWPVVGAVGQLVILVSASKLIYALPAVSEFEAIIAFILCGAIGPGLLTVGAVYTDRRLNRVR